MTDVPKPPEEEIKDPLAKKFWEEAHERHRQLFEFNADADKRRFEAWAAEQDGEATKEDYFHHCDALKSERWKLIDEMRRSIIGEEVQKELFEIQRAITDEDPSFHDEIAEAIRTIHFLAKDALDEDAPEELVQLAKEETEVAEKMIEEAALRRSKSAGDIWARLPAVRRRLAQAKTERRVNQDKLQQRVSEIEDQLPANTFWKDPDPDSYAASFWWGASQWNNAIRRVEFYNEGDTSSLPPHTADPWAWSDEQWDEWWDEVGDGPPEGFFNDPMEDLREDISKLQDEIDWLKIQLTRKDRIGDEYRGESEERFASMNETIINYNAERFRPSRGWHPSMEENIEMLQNMRMEGHSVEVLFNRRDHHVQRDLMARWGVDIGYATRIAFKVSHYSHMNCFYGQLETHPNATVLLGINMDRRNKLHVKTALRPLHEAEKWQYLEHKHLPGGIGFSKYTKHDLLEAHHKMVSELYGKKGPRR